VGVAPCRDKTREEATFAPGRGRRGGLQYLCWVDPPLVLLVEVDSVDEVAKVDGKRNSLGGSIKGKYHPDLDEEHCQTS
jgi:hypothetical protein